jgi:3-oxoacyl-[acyl-carrier protein] reductase
MKLGLDGAVVLVTGGSAGIGRAIVQSFLEEGAAVAYCSRKATGKEFGDHNPKAIGTQLDITDKEGLEAWIKRTAEENGGIDVVVSNGQSLDFYRVYTIKCKQCPHSPSLIPQKTGFRPTRPI